MNEAVFSVKSQSQRCDEDFKSEFSNFDIASEDWDKLQSNKKQNKKRRSGIVKIKEYVSKESEMKQKKFQQNSCMCWARQKSFLEKNKCDSLC